MEEKKNYVVIAKFGEDGMDSVQITKRGGELFTYEEAVEAIKDHLMWQDDGMTESDFEIVNVE